MNATMELAPAVVSRLSNIKDSTDIDDGLAPGKQQLAVGLADNPFRGCRSRFKVESPAQSGQMKTLIPYGPTPRELHNWLIRFLLLCGKTQATCEAKRLLHS